LFAEINAIAFYSAKEAPEIQADLKKKWIAGSSPQGFCAKLGKGCAKT
jgi:hypothetical protein